MNEFGKAAQRELVLKVLRRKGIDAISFISSLTSEELQRLEDATSNSFYQFHGEVSPIGEDKEGHYDLFIDVLGIKVRNRTLARIKAENASSILEVTPPKDAQFLMYALYNREHRESLLGDMEEDFQEAVALWNPRKAAWLYRIGVLRSFWPSLMAWAARGAIFGRLLEWLHKFAG